MKKIIFLVLLLLANTKLSAQWSNNQSAALALGQSDFTSYSAGTSANQLSSPYKIAIDLTNSKAYVADRGNSRVLRYSYPFTSFAPAAERVFGITGTAGCTQSRFAGNQSVAIYNDVLWVCDCNNHRILRFNNASTISSDAPNANGVIGQTDYTTNTFGNSSTKLKYPYDITIDASGNMWVADFSNHRTLRFSNVNSSAEFNAAADLALGQTDLNSNTAGTSQTGQKNPSSVAVLGTTVWVGEEGNSRVLRYDNPASSAVAANNVLGQDNFDSGAYTKTGQSGFHDVEGLAIDSNGRLYVSDYLNNRIMIFNNAASKGMGANADNILGEADWNNLAAQKGASGFNYTWGLAVDNTNNRLLVCDLGDNRIMQFNASSALPVQLISFTALPTELGIQLNWQTASEVNNYGFNVEVRIENEEWKAIAFVQGHGNSSSPKSYSFTDPNAPGGKVYYRLKQIDVSGKYEYSNVAEVQVKTPRVFSVKQNYPNPFNPSTVISYQLPVSSHVNVKIYDLLGREVTTLVNEVQLAGSHQVSFDGKNMPSAMYFLYSSGGKFFADEKDDVDEITSRCE